MPLSEFLRMARGKLDSDQRNPRPNDLSFRPESDVLELVWGNGQVMTQGQPSRVARTSTHGLPSNPHRVRDSGVGHPTTSRIGKFGGVDSFLNDTAPVVPSGDMNLTQDDDMDPWLNYAMDDDALPHYCSEFLPEISGVTGNGLSTQSSFLSAGKKSICDESVSNLNNGGNASKASSSKAHILNSWPPQQGQISGPSLGSGVSDIISNNSSKHPDVTYGNSVHCRNVVNDTRVEKQNVGQLSNSTNFLNFSRFSRPATLFNANLASSNGVPTSVSSVKEKGSTSTGSNPVKSPSVEQSNAAQKGIDFHVPSGVCAPVSSKQPVAKEYFLAERTDEFCQESSSKNEKPLIPGNIAADATKGHHDGERSLEPMVASSSVGSGNSVDRISCEQTHNSKRKFPDTEETEWRSDDIGTESAGVSKPTSARGVYGSKRSRAAEVHNLSERRRRDRINEKMRALQELIPNCNKADKASMLDEAIEYLKTLQLQVQIMSMGAGLCMPPMMFPQPMHPAHMPHFSPMGVGMGYGMGIVDMHGGSPGMPILPVPPMQGGHFPSPMSGPINFQRFPGPNLPVYGHPSQGHPNSYPGPGAPLVPLTGRPPVTSAMGLTPSRMGTHNELPGISPCLNSESPVTAQSMHNGEASNSIDCSSKQLQATTDGVLDQSAAVQVNKQATDIRGTIATDISEEAGGD